MLHLPYCKNRAEYTIQSINVLQFSSCFINLDYKGSTFWGNIQKNRVFLVKYLVNSKKSSTFAPAFEKKRVFLAQLVEQLTLNQWVQGSSPWEDTKRHPFGCLFFVLLWDEYPPNNQGAPKAHSVLGRAEASSTPQKGISNLSGKYRMLR